MNTDILLAIVVVIIFIVGPFWLIRRMDKSLARKGPLFTGKPTRGMRVLAIGLGFLFTGLFIMKARKREKIEYRIQEIEFIGSKV